MKLKKDFALNAQALTKAQLLMSLHLLSNDDTTELMGGLIMRGFGAQSGELDQMRAMGYLVIENGLVSLSPSAFELAKSSIRSRKHREKSKEADFPEKAAGWDIAPFDDEEPQKLAEKQATYAHDSLVSVAATARVVKAPPVPRKKKPGHDPSVEPAMRAAGVEDEDVVEFLALRLLKGKPMTPRTWRTIEREAAAAHWPIPAVIRYCVDKSYASFEAEWVKAKPLPGARPRRGGVCL